MPNTDAERVMSLVRKALSTHSVEESRTCALTAVQHIIKYHLMVVDPADLPKPAEPSKKKHPGAGGPAPHRRPHSPFPARAPSKISFHTKCMICEAAIYPGTEAFWMPAFNSAACPRCYESEILGSENWNGGQR